MGEIANLHLAWIASLNDREAARKAFMDANKHAPLRKEYDAAEAAEKSAKKAYMEALDGKYNESIS